MCHFSHLEFNLGGGKTDILSRCSPIQRVFLSCFNKSIHSYNPRSTLTNVEDVKAGSPFGRAVMDTGDIEEESGLISVLGFGLRIPELWVRVE